MLRSYPRHIHDFTIKQAVLFTIGVVVATDGITFDYQMLTCVRRKKNYTDAITLMVNSDF